MVRWVARAVLIGRDSRSAENDKPPLTISPIVLVLVRREKRQLVLSDTVDRMRARALAGLALGGRVQIAKADRSALAAWSTHEISSGVISLRRGVRMLSGVAIPESAGPGRSSKSSERSIH